MPRQTQRQRQRRTNAHNPLSTASTHSPLPNFLPSLVPPQHITVPNLPSATVPPQPHPPSPGDIPPSVRDLLLSWPLSRLQAVERHPASQTQLRPKRVASLSGDTTQHTPWSPIELAAATLLATAGLPGLTFHASTTLLSSLHTSLASRLTPEPAFNLETAAGHIRAWTSFAAPTPASPVPIPTDALTPLRILLCPLTTSLAYSLPNPPPEGRTWQKINVDTGFSRGHAKARAMGVHGGHAGLVAWNSPREVPSLVHTAKTHGSARRGGGVSVSLSLNADNSAARFGCDVLRDEGLELLLLLFSLHHLHRWVYVVVFDGNGYCVSRLGAAGELVIGGWVKVDAPEGLGLVGVLVEMVCYSPEPGEGPFVELGWEGMAGWSGSAESSVGGVESVVGVDEGQGVSQSEAEAEWELEDVADGVGLEDDIWYS